MSDWSFFPAEQGWGRVPVWGFAEVTASEHDALEVGTRVFGYLPPSTDLVDASPHRSSLPPAYNGYLRVDTDPAYDARYEDQQMLLRPLFLTAYLIDDFLDGRGVGRSDLALLSLRDQTPRGTSSASWA